MIFSHYLCFKNILKQCIYIPLQLQELLHETKHLSTYQAVYDGYKVAIETAKADVDELISAKCGASDSDHSQQNLDRCFLIKYR